MGRFSAPARYGVRREEFRDALRRAGDITGDCDFVVIGSQSVHGAFSATVLPKAATFSMEVDLLAVFDIDGDKAWRLAGADGGSGNRSEIDGVDITTATLPDGWVDRLIPFAVDDTAETVIGWCLEPHDLVVAKATAGRDKDRRFIEALVAASLINPAVVLVRLANIDLGARRPRPYELERAAAYLTSLRRPTALYRPASRRPPKGRRRPHRDDFPPPADMFSDLRP